MSKGYKHAEAAPKIDKLVFKKVIEMYNDVKLVSCLQILQTSLLPNLQVKEGLGGKLRLILSGAAPLSPSVETYLRVATCSHVLQGYGKLDIII